VQCAFPTFPNTRRIKNEKEWACSDEGSLVVLLQCCLPSLLSLFPQVISLPTHLSCSVWLF
jgi:hypothetical protein